MIPLVQILDACPNPHLIYNYFSMVIGEFGGLLFMKLMGGVLEIAFKSSIFCLFLNFLFCNCLVKYMNKITIL